MTILPFNQVTYPINKFLTPLEYEFMDFILMNELSLMRDTFILADNEVLITSHNLLLKQGSITMNQSLRN